MPLLIMANFMSEHRFQFGLEELLHEGVEEHDFAPATESGKKCIGVFRSFAAVHDLDIPCVKAGSLTQGQQTLSQRSGWERGELVEEGHNDRGCQDQHQELKGHDSCPRIN